MMRMIKGSLAAVALMLALGVCRPVLAGMPPPGEVTGTVDSIQGNQIVIDGHSYSVSVDGSALQDLQQVQPGQTVDVLLNGPANSAQTEVIAIHVHSGS